MPQQQRPSSNYIRTVTLERLALGIIPIFALFGLALLIAGVFWKVSIPSGMTTIYMDTLYGLCAPLILGLAGQNALGSLWGGGYGYSSYSYGGYTDPTLPQGTMGSGTTTQNQPTSAAPQG